LLAESEEESEAKRSRDYVGELDAVWREPPTLARRVGASPRPQLR